MQIKHCDMCGNEIKEDLVPIAELKASNPEQKIEARVRIVLEVRSVVRNKDFSEEILKNYNYLPSIPEMEKEVEGYDVCRDCWLRIFEKLKIEAFHFADSALA